MSHRAEPTEHAGAIACFASALAASGSNLRPDAPIELNVAIEFVLGGTSAAP